MSGVLPFDPDANKVTNEYGGYDPNEKGITQYPKYTEEKANSTLCSFQNPFPPREQTSRNEVFSDPILDPVTRHYRKFIQDPGLRTTHNIKSNAITDKFDCSSCCLNRKPCNHDEDNKGTRLRKPIDPVHWKPDLFDTKYEKYYLTNLINENPHREFLKSFSEDTGEPHYFTEYRERFSGNPTLETSSLKTIQGLSRPTDITESCDWRRNRTTKLRDAIFTQDKDPLDSHLDYNDPKRYNPWGRHLAGHALLIERNYRPRVGSGVDYEVTTVLPAVEPSSRIWIV